MSMTQIQPKTEADVRDGWMVLLQFSDGGGYIYDPRNGFSDEVDAEQVIQELEGGGSGELLIVRGEQRPDYMLDEHGGELLGWGGPTSSTLSMQTQALQVDDMDILGFDDAESVTLLWTRARLFADVLNAADFPAVQS